MMTGRRSLLSLSWWMACLAVAMICGNGVAQVSVRPASQISTDTTDWMKKVADWQLTQSSWDSSVDWLHGALFAGMMACYETTKDERYLDECRQVAQKFNWQLASTSHHADNNAVGQLYTELYLLDAQDAARIEGTTYNMTLMVTRDSATQYSVTSSIDSAVISATTTIINAFKSVT